LPLCFKNWASDNCLPQNNNFFQIINTLLGYVHGRKQKAKQRKSRQTSNRELTQFKTFSLLMLKPFVEKICGQLIASLHIQLGHSEIITKCCQKLICIGYDFPGKCIKLYQTENFTSRRFHFVRRLDATTAQDSSIHSTCINLTQ